ncbi:MAG TPA: CopG family transcriptional regulator [Thermoanaerobaculia bacterium]|nr:CopG family transcriptional regulator [Thermoanaerobaculia bacterium]
MAKLSEVRTQLYLPREQHRELKRVAREREVSMAQVVRDAVGSYLAHLDDVPGPKEEALRTDPIWSLPDRARDFGREETARDHDALLYGPDES